MPRKVTPADRVRKEFMDAVGESSLEFSGYCRLAAQSMLQMAMEVEAAEFVGRQQYERRGQEHAAYRNGFKRRRVSTGEGAVELQVPQTRNGIAPFRTAILGAYQRPSAGWPKRFTQTSSPGGPAAWPDTMCCTCSWTACT